MLTLDRWREFAVTPKTLVFPRLELIGLDHSPPIVVGSGEVNMNSPNEFEFVLRGTPADAHYAFAELRRYQVEPYALHNRPRLIGIDATGINWAGGYTIPVVSTQDPVWTFTGTLEVLSTDDRTSSVAREPGTELILPLRVGDPMALHLARYVRGIQSATDPVHRRQHELTVLGSKIRFSSEPDSTLLITSTWSREFRAPYCENWLSEPLRILFGQLIFPCLVARNFGDGRAAVSVRRCPPVITPAHWTALWQMEDEQYPDEVFWSTYASLLTHVAQARNKQGNPNFEANKITRLYEECIQAALSTRWVWVLTFASANEALAKMLDHQKGTSELEKAAAAVTADWEVARVDLTRHIEAWRGDEGLRRRAIGALLPPPKGTAKVLRELQVLGVINAKQFSAWTSIRHAVMHGSLVSPYSTKEEDEKLLSLAQMFHALTREIIRQQGAVGDKST
jgi:hypothetical protein